MMRFLAASMSILAFAFQTAPTFAEEKFNIENFKNIRLGHPDYLLKAQACDFIGNLMMELVPRTDEDGSTRKTLFFTNKQYEVFNGQFYKLAGAQLMEVLKSPRSTSFRRSLGRAIAHEQTGEKVVDACTDILFEIYNRAFANNGSSQASKSGNSNAHEKCLQAKDYEGCIKVKSGNSTAITNKECEPFKWCIAGTGTDMLGMPKIKGWGMRSNPSDQSVGYRRPRMQKVNVRGETNRYIIKEMIIRYYQSPRAAIAGSTTSIGSSSTNCAGYGSTINCTTTPATTLTSPGIPGRTGGVVQMRIADIVDCKEMTLGLHIDGQLRGKWKPVVGTDMERNAAKYCPIRESLELSTFSKYADD